MSPCPLTPSCSAWASASVIACSASAEFTASSGRGGVVMTTEPGWPAAQWVATIRASRSSSSTRCGERTPLEAQ
ncbi:hypothetical protein SMICM17S_04381 [Streptomyces microflavus]